MRALMLGLMALSMPAAAQQVYKCVQGKQVVYQSDPCPGQAVRAWDAKPEAYDPYRAAQVEAARQQVQQQNAYTTAPYRQAGPVGTSVSIAADRDRCENAKRQRENVFRAVGLRRTFELTRRMDDQVYSACK